MFRGETKRHFCGMLIVTGETAGASDRMHLYVEDMRIEKVESEHSRGFGLRKGTMAYSHGGYPADGRKQALAFRGLMAKFSQSEELKEQLLDTGDAYLVERGET